MKTTKELFESGAMLVRDYNGHEQMLMNEGTFINLVETSAPIKKQFIEGELDTIEQHEINSLIMSQASDIAERIVDLECKLNGITCYIVEMEGDTEVSTYTEEAQDMFNIVYDEQFTELYALLNAQLKVIK